MFSLSKLISQTNLRYCFALYQHKEASSDADGTADVLLHLRPIKNIFCFAKRNNFHLGWVPPSDDVITSDGVFFACEK